MEMIKNNPFDANSSKDAIELFNTGDASGAKEATLLFVGSTLATKLAIASAGMKVTRKPGHELLLELSLPAKGTIFASLTYSFSRTTYENFSDNPEVRISLTELRDKPFSYDANLLSRSYPLFERMDKFQSISTKITESILEALGVTNKPTIRVTNRLNTGER
jgi:hypothetical protein